MFCVEKNNTINESVAFSCVKMMKMLLFHFLFLYSVLLNMDGLAVQSNCLWNNDRPSNWLLMENKNTFLKEDCVVKALTGTVL